MKLQCPFCEATLRIGRQSIDCDGETGGILTSRRYECDVCGMEISCMTTDKVLDRKERWRLHASPQPDKVTRSFHATFPQYACPRCADGDLVPAIPVGEIEALPVNPDTIEGTHHERTIEYYCNRCSQRCLRYEAGRVNALTVGYWACLTEVRDGRSPLQGLQYVLMPEAPMERPRFHSEAK